MGKGRGKAKAKVKPQKDNNNANDLSNYFNSSSSRPSAGFSFGLDVEVVRGGDSGESDEEAIPGPKYCKKEPGEAVTVKKEESGLDVH